MLRNLDDTIFKGISQSKLIDSLRPTARSFILSYQCWSSINGRSYRLSSARYSRSRLKVPREKDSSIELTVPCSGSSFTDTACFPSQILRRHFVQLTGWSHLSTVAYYWKLVKRPVKNPTNPVNRSSLCIMSRRVSHAAAPLRSPAFAKNWQPPPPKENLFIY